MIDGANSIAFETNVPKLDFTGLFESAEDVVPHTHPCIELVYVIEGHCAIGVGSKWIEGKPGTLYILPPNKVQIQQTMMFTRNNYIGFYVAPQLFNSEFRRITISENSPIPGWIKDLYELNQKPEQLPPIIFSGLLITIISFINHLEKHVANYSLLHSSVVKAVEYIQEHFLESMSVEEISKKANISPSHLTTLFRKQLGMGITKFILVTRMNQAQTLLKNPYLTIREVGYNCGFQDTNYFARVFRKYHGKSPGEWRKQSQYAGEIQLRQINS